MTSARQAPQRLTIGFVLAKDFTMSAFALFIDTIRLAADEGDRSGKVRCDWNVLSSGGHLIRSSTGVQVAPTARLGDPTRYCYIVVVGGLLRDPEPLDAECVAFLKRADVARVPIVGICTGAFILARHGLMDRRRACVSWLHYQQFKDEFPNIDVRADRMFVVDRDRITCCGGSGAADVAAYIVEERLGPKIKQKALQVLQIEKARPASDPQPRTPVEINVQNARLKRALLLMEQNISEPLRIEELARTCNVSVRNLERIFTAELGATPADAYKRIRLDMARKLVVDTDRPLTDIALSTGFCHPSSFSHGFKKLFGISPSRARAEARPAAAE